MKVYARLELDAGIDHRGIMIADNGPAYDTLAVIPWEHIVRDAIEMYSDPNDGHKDLRRLANKLRDVAIQLMEASNR